MAQEQNIIPPELLNRELYLVFQWDYMEYNENGNNVNEYSLDKIFPTLKDAVDYINYNKEKKKYQFYLGPDIEMLIFNPLACQPEGVEYVSRTWGNYWRFPRRRGSYETWKVANVQDILEKIQIQ